MASAQRLALAKARANVDELPILLAQDWLTLIAEIARLEDERLHDHTIGCCGNFKAPDSCRDYDLCITEWCLGCTLDHAVDEGKRADAASSLLDMALAKLLRHGQDGELCERISAFLDREHVPPPKAS